MGSNKNKNGCIIKTIFAMYIVTGLLLVLLAFFVSKADNEEMVAKVGVICVYVISCGLGGFMIGKWKQQKKYLWGFLVGAIYVGILLGIGIVIGRGDFPDLIAMLTAACICIGAGTIGGMIS